MSDFADREAQEILNHIKGLEHTPEAFLFLAQKIRVIHQLGKVDGVASCIADLADQSEPKRNP